MQDADWDHIMGWICERDKIVLGIYSDQGESIGFKGAVCHEINHEMPWKNREFNFWMRA